MGDPARSALASGIIGQSRVNDKHFVRHIYDLYHLNISGLLTGSYRDIVAKTIEKDKKQFRRQNQSYTDNPIRASEEALDSIFQDLQWRSHWEYFLNQMVYEKDKPSFDKAYEQLRQLSKEVLYVLKTKQK